MLKISIVFSFAMYFMTDVILAKTTIQLPGVIAHRGGKAIWPENTMWAFDKSVELGVEWLEFDLQMTSDGELVVLHDETVDRTTNGNGRIDELSLAEIQTLDAGYQWTSDNGMSFPFRNVGITIPTFEDLLSSLPSSQKMIIELKETADPLKACEALLAHKKTNVVIGSFNEEKLKTFKNACQEIPVSGGRTQIRNLYISHLAFLSDLYRPKIHSVQLPIDPEESEGKNLVTKRFIKALKRQKIEVHVWTVNEEIDMRRLIDLGVEGIITDDPILLKNILAEYK